ncbi:MAG TPA: GIY-YIG nuclease family protein [Chthoniobacterales bacterium]|nr:GIY-YIG nuclease family protein [Chthoniobacterales bacterium]
MFSVYVLKSGATGRRYVGSCANLSDRLRRHNAGESLATKHGMPGTLIHAEQFPTRVAAAARERYFKTGQGRDELDHLQRAERSPRRQVAASCIVTPTPEFPGDER